jgi:7-cyano-7-deazaguanine synthase
MTKAIVVLSGGQDSTTCLGIALRNCESVEAIAFDYGQKHVIEIAAAQRICDQHDVRLTIIDLRPILQNMRSSALVTHGDTTEKHPILKDLPASFVPARNALFLTTAYGIAMEHGCDVIYTGVCQTDYSGYPDCRDEFIKSLNKTLNLGYQSEIGIITPLMFLTKAQTFQLAAEYGILGTVINESITCYEGDRVTKNVWGFGCGKCPACKLRAKGWDDYKLYYERVSNMQ